MKSKLAEALKVTASELESMTPAQIDELFAAIDEERSRIYRDLDTAWDRLYQALCLDKITQQYGRGSRQVWPLDRPEALDLAELHLTEGFMPDARVQIAHGVQGDRYAKGLRDALDGINVLTREVDALTAGPRRILEGEWERRGRWSRMFLCLSDGGHLHKSLRGCSSLRFDTPMGWLPELSGMEWREAYKVYAKGREGGEAIMCSHCYKDAPKEWTESQVKEDDKKCSATGRYGWSYLNPRDRRKVSKYIKCPECDKTDVALTPNGNIRKHDRKQG